MSVSNSTRAGRGFWADAWRRPDTRGMIAFHNAVHGEGQRAVFEDDGVLVLARGDRGIEIGRAHV